MIFFSYLIRGCHFLLVISSNFGPIPHRFRDMATYSLKNFTKIAAKPLQLETWLLLTANRKLPPPYPIVPSPTTYNSPFNHNTSVKKTDRRMDVPKTLHGIAIARQEVFFKYI